MIVWKNHEVQNILKTSAKHKSKRFYLQSSYNVGLCGIMYSRYRSSGRSECLAILLYFSSYYNLWHEDNTLLFVSTSFADFGGILSLFFNDSPCRYIYNKVNFTILSINRKKTTK